MRRVNLFLLALAFINLGLEEGIWFLTGHCEVWGIPMVDLGLYWSHCCWLSYGCHSHLCPLPDLCILFSRPSTVAMSASSVFQDLECRCLVFGHLYHSWWIWLPGKCYPQPFHDFIVPDSQPTHLLVTWNSFSKGKTYVNFSIINVHVAWISAQPCDWVWSIETGWKQ